MSYINDALRKVQKEKESGYVGYEQIVSATGGSSKRPRKWLPIVALAIVIFFAAALIVLLYWPGDKKIPASPAKAPVRTQAVASVVPAVPPVVKETIKATAADKKDNAGIKKETATSEHKDKPEKTDSKVLYAEAIQKQQEGKLDEAKELYKKVIKINPRNVEALNNLGVIYMTKKTYKWAIIRFNDALKIKHNYPDAHYNLACLYAQRNDSGKSLQYLKKAVRYNPEVRKWAKEDGDLHALADLPEFKKLMEKQ
jgi:tetratricopeptide (TPR) repeat protein